MTMYAVTTGRGPSWQPDTDIRGQVDWNDHAQFMDGLVAEGHVVLGGPIAGAEDEVALLAIEADSADVIDELFRSDPWVVSGVLTLKQVRPWTIWLDSRRPR